MTGIDGDEIIRDSIDSSGGDLRLLQVSPQTLSRYIKIASEDSSGIQNTRVLAAEDTLKEVMDDFIIASAASDLIKQGKLELLSIDDEPQRSLVVVGDAAVMSFINLGNEVGALSSDDDRLVERSREVFDSLWSDGEEFKIRTPPISDVKQTLRDDIGRETEQDFSSMLGVLEKAKGDGEGLDEITLALLAAARNKILLYDISKWGEDSGVASKATFSRKKTEMESQGLIDTENVPIDIGRPRLRLKFADDELESASIDELVERAEQAMS